MSDLRCARLARYVLLHRGLGQIDPDHVKLTYDAGRTPGRVGRGHLANQSPNRLGYGWPARFPGARQLPPVFSEPTSSPLDNRTGLNEYQGLLPTTPPPREPGPEKTISRPHPRAFDGSLVDPQLVAQSEDLQVQGKP